MVNLPQCLNWLAGLLVFQKVKNMIPLFTFFFIGIEIKLNFPQLVFLCNSNCLLS